LALALFYSGQYEQARLLYEKAILGLDTAPAAIDRQFCKLILDLIDLLEGNYQAVLDDAALRGEPLLKNLKDEVFLYKAMVHLLMADQKASAGKASDDPEVLGLRIQAQQELEKYLQFYRSMPRFDTIGLPLALLGYIAYRRGKLDEARQYLQDALENGLKQGFFWVFMLALSVLAVMLAESGKLEEAVEVYATATAHPCAANSRWWEDMFGRRLTALTASLPAETLAAAQARGRARSLAEAGQQYLERLRTSPALLGNLGPAECG
jgi:tetratricopeptide (TPR) repeat protein